VGVEGSYDALEPVVRTYAEDASQVYFPYPLPLSPASVPRGPAMMVMTFDRAVFTEGRGRMSLTGTVAFPKNGFQWLA